MEAQGTGGSWSLEFCSPVELYDLCTGWRIQQEDTRVGIQLSGCVTPKTPYGWSILKHQLIIIFKKQGQFIELGLDWEAMILWATQ